MVEQANLDRKAKAEEWIETQLEPAFAAVEKQIQDKEFRQYLAPAPQDTIRRRSSLARTLKLQYLPGGLAFRMKHGRESYVKYRVRLEVTTEGVTGHIGFKPPVGKTNEKDEPNILKWTQEKIVKDFWKEYKSWQPMK